MPILIQKILKQAKTTFACVSEAFTERLIELCNLMDQVTAEDVNLDISFAERSIDDSKYAPVSYVEIYEDKILSMGIFILKPNKILPLHNHPEMHGVIKVLAGKVAVESYSINTPKTVEADKQFSSTKEKLLPEKDAPTTLDAATMTDSLDLIPSLPTLDASTSTTSVDSQNNVIPLKRVVSAEFNGRDIVDINSKPCILKPNERNIHEIRSIDGPAAFLDILAPPYDTDIPYVGPRICTYFANLGLVVENVFLLQEIKNPPFFWTDSKPYLGPDPTIEVE